jgi:hypothetical protein
MAIETTSAADFGERIMALADRLAQWSEIPDGLTCTYLTPAHRWVTADADVAARVLLDAVLRPAAMS